MRAITYSIFALSLALYTLAAPVPAAVIDINDTYKA